MYNIITLLTLPLFVTGSAASSVRPVPLDSTDMTLVEVQNDRNVPVTVWAQNNVGEYKLGVVQPGSAMTMRLSEFVVMQGDIQFFVKPTGQREESTGLVEMHRGERIGLVVPPKR